MSIIKSKNELIKLGKKEKILIDKSSNGKYIISYIISYKNKYYLIEGEGNKSGKMTQIYDKLINAKEVSKQFLEYYKHLKSRQ